MEFLSPKPDALRSLAVLALSMTRNYLVTVWQPCSGVIATHGYTPWHGVVRKIEPEEGSGHNWIVTLDTFPERGKELFIKLDTYPQCQILET